MNNLVRLLSLGLIVALAACNLEPDDTDGYEEEEVGEAQQAFLGWVGPLTVVSNGGVQTATTGVSSGTNAFLSGVGGNLSTNVFQPYVMAQVPGGTTFELAVRAGTSRTLGGQAWAVYTGTNYSYGSCHSSGTGDHHAVALQVPASGNFACFLTTVRSIADQFNSYDDSAYVTYSGQSATLHCYNDANATARCIPVSGTDAILWKGLNTGTTHTSLGAVNWTTGKICGLGGIWGRYRTNNAGVGVAAYNDGSTWWLDTAMNTGANAVCVH